MGGGHLWSCFAASGLGERDLSGVIRKCQKQNPPAHLTEHPDPCRRAKHRFWNPRTRIRRSRSAVVGFHRRVSLGGTDDDGVAGDDRGRP